MGVLSDRLSRVRVMMAGGGALCSFLFGWTIDRAFFWVLGLGLLYAFAAPGGFACTVGGLVALGGALIFERKTHPPAGSASCLILTMPGAAGMIMAQHGSVRWARGRPVGQTKTPSD